MRRLFAAAALLMLLPTSLAANVEPARFEFGTLERGHERDEHIVVTNPATEPATIHLSPGGDAWDTFLDVEPLEFTLGPGGTRDVTVHLSVPRDATPGRHDLDIQVVEMAGPGSGGTGQAGIDVRLVFEVAAADLTYLERQEDGVLAIVDNWLDDAVEGRIEAQWLDAEGEPLGSFGSQDLVVPAKSREYVTLAGEAPADAVALRARAVLDGIPGGWMDLALGDSSKAALAGLRVEPGKGGAVLAAEVRNPTPERATVRVVFEILEAGASVATHESDVMDVAPGTTRTVTWTWSGAPGTYTARARLMVADAAGPWLEAGEPFTVAKRGGGTPGFGAVLMVVAAVVALAGAAVARRRS